ncbi:MAG: hypothetical protein ACOVP4_12850 [Bacteriovoracaceae bacterium]
MNKLISWECYHYTPMRVHLGVSIPIVFLLAMNLFFVLDIIRFFFLAVVSLAVLFCVNFYLRKIDTKEPCLKFIDNQLCFRIKNQWLNFNEVDGQIEFFDSQQALKIKYLTGEFVMNVKPANYVIIKERLEQATTAIYKNQ